MLTILVVDLKLTVKLKYIFADISNIDDKHQNLVDKERLNTR